MEFQMDIFYKEKLKNFFYNLKISKNLLILKICITKEKIRKGIINIKKLIINNWVKYSERF
jgi:hypothetical protein